MLFEYGNEGLEGRYYPKNIVKVEKVYESIMGQKKTVYIYKITSLFEELKLNVVYKAIDELKDSFTNYDYSFVSKNCRHFTRELGNKLNTKEEGSEFFDFFVSNLPHILKIALLRLFYSFFPDISQKYYEGKHEF